MWLCPPTLGNNRGHLPCPKCHPGLMPHPYGLRSASWCHPGSHFCMFIEWANTSLFHRSSTERQSHQREKLASFFFPQMPKIQIEKCKEQEQQRKYDSLKVTRDFNMRMQWWRDLWNVENKFKRMSKRLLRKKSWDKKIHIQYGRKSAYWKEIKIKYYEWKVQSVKQKITVKIHDNRFFWGKRKNIPTRGQNFG